MNETKGTIDGKRNRRLQNLFIKRKKKTDQIKEVEVKEKELEEKKKKEKELLINNELAKEKENINKQKTSNDIKEPVINPVVTKVKIKPKTDSEIKKLDEIKNKDEKVQILKPDIKDIKLKQEEIVVVKPKKKFGIEEKELDLNKENNIESNKNQTVENNNELTEKKKIIKEKNIVTTEVKINNQKELLELAVINEFTVILENHRYDLDNLIVDYKILKDKVDSAIEVDELDKISEEIEELVRKLEIIKKEMALLTSSATFNDIYKLHDPYLENIIDEYRESLLFNKEMLDTVTNLEKDKLHVSLINKISELEIEKEKLTLKLNDTKEKYEIRDEEFLSWKKEYLNIDDINKELDSMAILADEKLDEIIDLVNKSVDVREIVEHRMMGTLEIMARTMMIMALLRRNPMMQASAAMAGGTIATFNAIRRMINPDLGERRRVVTDITDYKNMIVDSMHDMENVNQLINDGITEVSRMKKVFEDEFKEYKYDFPEYKEIFEKLENIEKEMFNRRENMNRISRELENQYAKNNAKVRVYENMETR